MDKQTLRREVDRVADVGLKGELFVEVEKTVELEVRVEEVEVDAKGEAGIQLELELEFTTEIKNEVSMKRVEMPSLLLVDGMALLFRAFFATSYNNYYMVNSKGIPTNAIYGFVKYMWDAIETFKPTHVVCCWDMGSKTFRSQQYVHYKANRPAAPNELIPQFDLVKEVVESFNIPNIGIPGYEADDCIGTLATMFSEDMNVSVLSGDHDMLQLISERIQVIIMKKGQSNYAVYNLETLMSEKQITPLQVIDMKGLTGDTADNYPGVKGIGEKTALKLLQEYRTIEGILDNLAELPKGVRAKIEADLDMLHLSRDLARIRCDVPVECIIDQCCWSPDPDTIRLKFEELEFSNLMKLIG